MTLLLPAMVMRAPFFLRTLPVQLQVAQYNGFMAIMRLCAANAGSATYSAVPLVRCLCQRLYTMPTWQLSEQGPTPPMATPAHLRAQLAASLSRLSMLRLGMPSSRRCTIFEASMAKTHLPCLAKKQCQSPSKLSKAVLGTFLISSANLGVQRGFQMRSHAAA